MKMLWLRLKNMFYLLHLKRRDLPPSILEYLRGFLDLDYKKPVSKIEYVVLDTETTGFNVKKGHRIVSLSAIRLKEGRIDLADTFHTLVNPGRDIPGEAAVIHEILPRMVEDKSSLEKILPDFIGYIGAAVLVGHHAWVDLSFLNQEMMRLYGFPLQNMVVDTAVLDQALMGGKTSGATKGRVRTDSRLSALAERYHVPLEERHSSFADALTTAQIFQVMLKHFQRYGLRSLKDLLRLAFTPPSFRISPSGPPSA
ncbi:MAG: 3'-5' exonuclease [Thermodesulfobacteriota bacterium]